MRLILLTGPVAAVLCGLVLGAALDWSLNQFLDFDAINPTETPDASSKKPKVGKGRGVEAKGDLLAPLINIGKAIEAKALSIYNSAPAKVARKLVAVLVAFGLFQGGNKYGREFWDYSHKLAEQLSSPSIMFHAQLRDGTTITVDDYRQAYWWLRDNTPQDSRVMAWWDYGYQVLI